MIFDTSFLVDLLRGKDSEALLKSKEIESSFEEALVPTIVLLELWRGVFLSQNVSRKTDEIRNLIKSCTLIQFTEEDAFYAAKIESELRLSGKIIDLEDIMIAGMARARKQKILTRNVEHFERISGIEIEMY